MTNHRLPVIVILPGEHLDTLAVTLESIAGALPKAAIHVVRPGIPALDLVADMVAAAGLQVVDVPAVDGFPAVLDALDARFAHLAYCWLFAGESLGEEQARVLAHGGQLTAPSPFAWLERRSPLAAPRVRASGTPVRSSRLAQLAAFQPCGSWRACLLSSVRAAFSSYEHVYEDVCVLAQLGELDAAFQRAELSWSAAHAVGDVTAGLRLARATVMIGRMLSQSANLIPACAHWFHLEPEPFVALVYVRIAEGSIPFALVDGLLSLAPDFADVSYRDGLVVEPLEQVLALRTAVAVDRHTAKNRHDGVLRMMRANAATPGEIGTAVTLAFILGLPSLPIVEALPDGAQNPMLADCVNVNLEVDFLARLLQELTARFARQPWLVQLVERFVLTRNVDAALAIDRAGLTGYHHWSHLSSVAWIPDEMRGKALVRAVVHGELDAAEASRRALALDERARRDVAALLADLLAEEVAA